MPHKRRRQRWRIQGLYSTDLFLSLSWYGLRRLRLSDYDRDPFNRTYLELPMLRNRNFSDRTVPSLPCRSQDVRISWNHKFETYQLTWNTIQYGIRHHLYAPKPNHIQIGHSNVQNHSHIVPSAPNTTSPWVSAACIGTNGLKLTTTGVNFTISKQSASSNGAIVVVRPLLRRLTVPSS